MNYHLFQYEKPGSVSVLKIPVAFLLPTQLSLVNSSS